MATDAKKHTTIAAGEKPSRGGLAAAILSIRDVIAVANATEATQVAAAVAATGQNLTTDPVIVSRADARGLHRVEYSYDGTVWLPVSGVLVFASKTAADTWAAANASYLSVLDECRVGTTAYSWSGAGWVAQDTGWQAVTLQNSWTTATAGEEVEVRALNGVVYLKGRAASGTSGVAFTLPAGFRPKSIIRTYVYSPAGAGANTLVTINTGGTVVLVSGAQPQFANIAPFPADA